MIALIDSDIVAWRNASATENDSEVYALVGCDKTMQSIVDDTSASEYKAFLTGDTNFRLKINPEYKANRIGKPKPKHLVACKEFLVREWNAVISEGCEADDLLGVNQQKESDSEGSYNTVVCTIDKDLRQVPGLHYNFVTKEYFSVSYLKGLKEFYKQMLIGDTSDNVFGVKGIGKVKAAAFIDHLETEEEMYGTVFELYKDTPRLESNADCLWIWRQQGENYSKRVECRETESLHHFYD